MNSSFFIDNSEKIGLFMVISVFIMLLLTIIESVIEEKNKNKKREIQRKQYMIDRQRFLKELQEEKKRMQRRENIKLIMSQEI